jgi:hypothetical protein
MQKFVNVSDLNVRIAEQTETVEFNATGGAAESPYLFDADGSTVDYDRRVANGSDYFIYRFEVPAGHDRAILSMDIMGNYAVNVSTDNSVWTEVGRVEEYVPRYALGAREVILHAFLPGFDGGEVYLRFEDQTPINSNGVSLYSLKLTTWDTAVRTYANGQTITFTVDNPLNRRIAVDFSLVDSQASTQVSTGHPATFSHAISPINARPNSPAITVPITITEARAEQILDIDRSFGVGLEN